MKNEITIEQAIKRLKQAMIEEPDYAHVWHCNIAMAFYDSKTNGIKHDHAHRIGNDGASRFMSNCFGVVTSNDMLMANYKPEYYNLNP